MRGPQASVGPQGPVGLQGFQGVIGSQGSRGPQGIRGQQGAQGSQGTIPLNVLIYGQGVNPPLVINAGNSPFVLSEDGYFTDVTVDASGVLDTNGYRVFINGTLLLNGTIENDGGSAVTSTPGTGAPSGSLGGGSNGGGGGTAGVSIANALGGPGGEGGTGVIVMGMTIIAFAGAFGGTVTPPLPVDGGSNLAHNALAVLQGRTLATNVPFNGGSGGGGGGNASFAGAGGGGGGVIVLAAYMFDPSSMGTIRANGGVGGDGRSTTVGSTTNSGGGGGGGGGGFVSVFTSCTGIPLGVSVTALGGVGGIGETPASDGSTGSNGTVSIFIT